MTYIYTLWNRIAERLRIVDRARRRRHVDWYVWDHGDLRPLTPPGTSTSGPDKPLQPGEPTMDLLTPKEDR